MIVAVPGTRGCIVVGAGVVGLATAWALSRRGWRVAVLEAAASVGHQRGGSKGGARIFRLGYPDPLYVEMAVLARDLWRALEVAGGRRLLHPGGQLTFGDEATVHAVAAALAAAGAPAKRLSAADAAARFPGVAVRGPVLFEPESGVLAADECLRALRVTADVELHTGVRVMSLTECSGGVRVETADGRTLDADVVVDCAGAQALALLGDGRPRAVAAAASLPQVAYFRPAHHHAARTLPVFIEWGDAMVYGLPVPAGGAPHGTYKVSHHTPGTALDAFDPGEPAPLGDDDPTLLATLTSAVARLLPALDPVPVGTERCVYDNSADTDFVLDRVGGVVVGCGTSGHGFKFGPLLGELLADLAEGAAPRVDMSRFRLDRSTSR
jgi:sarcosine oxidase